MPKQKNKSKYCKHIWKPLGVVKRDIIREIVDGANDFRKIVKMGDEVIAVIYCEKCGAWKSRKF